MISFSDVLSDTEQALRANQQWDHAAPEQEHRDPLGETKAQYLHQLSLPATQTNRTESVKALLSVAYLDMSLTDFESARPHLEQALELVDEELEPALYAGVLKLYTDTLMADDEINEILTNYEKSATLLLEHGEHIQAASALYELAQFEETTDSFERAIAFQTKALGIFREADLPWAIQKSEMHLARLFLKTGEAGEALQHAQSGLLHLQASISPDATSQWVANAYMLIGEIQVALDNAPDARAAYRNALRTVVGSRHTELEEQAKEALQGLLPSTKA